MRNENNNNQASKAMQATAKKLKPKCGYCFITLRGSRRRDWLWYEDHAPDSNTVCCWECEKFTGSD